MSESNSLRWLEWAREIQSMSQIGLTYSLSDYDTRRYTRLMEIAAEMVASHTQLAKDSLFENFMQEPGYATPKVDVRAAIVRDGQILLVQERSDERWCMPGGWADVGDLPSAAIAREVWEESGFEVVVRKVVGVYDANRYPPLEFNHAYKIVFLCEIVGGKARGSDETLAVDFFNFDNWPPLSSNRTNEQHLAEVLAHVNDPTRATHFD